MMMKIIDDDDDNDDDNLMSINVKKICNSSIDKRGYCTICILTI